MLWTVLAVAVIVIALTRRRRRGAAAPLPAHPEAPREAEFLPARLGAPLGHEGDRQPVGLDELEHRLREAGLGTVRREGGTVELSQGAAAVRLQPADPARVVRSQLTVTATRLELLALAVDALAPAIGAVELTWSGATLTLDGTMPRGAVERAAHRVLADRQRELERLQRTQAKRPDDQLLH